MGWLGLLGLVADWCCIGLLICVICWFVALRLVFIVDVMLLCSVLARALFVSSGCLISWLHFNGVILVVSVLVWVVLFVFWIGRGGIVC